MKVAAFAILVCLVGCGSKSVSEEELIAYTLNPENGLRTTSKKEPFLVEVIYRPKDLIKAIELKSLEDVHDFGGRAEQIDSLEYFVIRLSRNGQEIESALAGDDLRFTQAINYLSSGIDRTLALSVGGKRIPVFSSVYSGAFGSATSTSILVVFDTKFEGSEDEIHLHFDDSFFGIGATEFTFDAKDLVNAPHLNFNNL